MPTKLQPELQRAVGLFSTRSDAEAALSELRESGFNMDKVSVVNKNSDTEKMQGATVNDQKGDQIAGATGAGAKAGGITGGTLGLIGSLGVLAIPGVGPIAEVGLLLANTVLGGVIGAAGGGLVGALVGWGVPEDRAKYYNDRVYDSGDYLIMVEGDATTIQSAQTVLGNNQIRDWQTFSSAEDSYQGAMGNTPTHQGSATPQPPM